MSQTFGAGGFLTHFRRHLLQRFFHDPQLGAPGVGSDDTYNEDKLFIYRNIMQMNASDGIEVGLILS